MVAPPREHTRHPGKVLQLRGKFAEHKHIDIGLEPASAALSGVSLDGTSP